MEGDRLIQCVFKKYFPTEEEVKAFAKQNKQNWYKCIHCNGYHITSQPTYDSIMNKE